MIAWRVKIRLIRQQVLPRDTPLKFVTVLDESVLHRRLGNRSVMHTQFQRLADRRELPNVTFRILPLDTDHGLAADSFIILQFGDDVYVEGLVGDIYLERQKKVARYREAIEYLRDTALNPRDSAALI